MNQTNRYRLEALVELANAYPESRSSATIAERRGIPAAYLSRLLAELARAGWIRSRRGPGGGVCLAYPPRSIPVGAAFAETGAADGLPPALERLEKTINDAVEAATRDLTIADIVRWERRAAAAADYCI